VRGLNAFAWGATVFGMTRRKMPPAVQQGYLAPYDGWGSRISTLRFVQDIPLVPGARGYDVVKATADKLSMFRDVPTYIGWGDRDFVFDQPFLDEWKRHLPHARIRQFSDAGHYVLEDAGDVLIPEIASFIRGA
jgi:haloalkane dehalogenase